MKVLLNDGMDEEGIELFRNAGIETDAEKKDPEALVRHIGEYDALVVRSATKVTRQVIEAGVRGSGCLKVVGRAGVGYDNIDVAAASEHGVVVKFAPHGNTNATAELALGLMLAVSRNIPQAHHSLKSGIWLKKPLRGVELSLKTLGVIGCGRIGQRLGELARGFDMRVIGYDLYPDPQSRIEYVSRAELLAQADYLSLHTGGSEVIIGREELSLMKSSAYLINASRGQNVDEEALCEALTTGAIAGAGLDVYASEPKKEESEFTNRLRELPNVVLTSHLGASTAEAQKKTSVEMAQVIVDYLQKGGFANAVNAGERIESEERPVYPLFVSHRDIPGVFAKIDAVLGDSGVNIRETSSRLLGKSGFAMTVYLVHQKVGPQIVEKLGELEDVSSVRV